MVQCTKDNNSCPPSDHMKITYNCQTSLKMYPVTIYCIEYIIVNVIPCILYYVCDIVLCILYCTTKIEFNKGFDFEK